MAATYDANAAPSFPRAPLLGAAGLVCLALAGATYGRLSGLGAAQPISTAISARYLRFADRADGAVLVFDAGSRTPAGAAEPIEIATGQNGFLRGTLRGFARTRHAEGIGAEAPFLLTAWADGRLTLQDPSTGRRAELGAFGPSNVAVFARMLVPPARMAAAATTGKAVMR
jgi:putative photosynthetic complex assembly protein